MLFASIIFIVALFIESIGTYISIFGLTSLFVGNIVIVLMAIALDIGKITTVSFAYQYWSKINLAIKSYLILALIILMTITSTGIFGYLTDQFQNSIIATNTQTIVINNLKTEQQELISRKNQINLQIADMPKTFVNGRIRLMDSYKVEMSNIDSKLTAVNSKLQDLEISNVQQKAKIGPAMYIAETFNTTIEKAVKWIILIIIFVFDPLSIILFIAANFIISEKSKIALDSKKN